MITWAETQLIGAEAALATGNAGLAQQYLDAVRANRSFGSYHAVPQPRGLERLQAHLSPGARGGGSRQQHHARGEPDPGSNSLRPDRDQRQPQHAEQQLGGYPGDTDGSESERPDPCPVLNYTSSTPLAELTGENGRE